MMPKLRPRDEESLLGCLHPRQICWLLAVWQGCKPTTWIESVEIKAWDGFLGLIRSMNLCCSYETPAGRAFVQGATLAEAPEGVTGLMFVPEHRWNDVLRGGVPCDFDHLDPRPPLAEPRAYLHSFVQAYVARTIDDLVDAMRARETHDSAGMGRAFGYPECCVAEYRRAGEGAGARNEFNKRLLEEGLDQRMQPEMWATYHVPCSPDCAPSARLARSYLGSVRSCSRILYYRVIEGLSLSRLSYSTSERFLDLKEVPGEDLHGAAPGRRPVRKMKSFLRNPEEVLQAYTTRPLCYVDWEEPPYRVRMLPATEGLKWVAYRTGRGAVVIDALTDDVDIFVDVKALPNEQRPYAETAFHLFRCPRSPYHG